MLMMDFFILEAAMNSMINMNSIKFVNFYVTHFKQISESIQFNKLRHSNIFIENNNPCL